MANKNYRFETLQLHRRSSDKKRPGGLAWSADCDKLLH